MVPQAMKGRIFDMFIQLSLAQTMSIKREEKEGKKQWGYTPPTIS
jgi:hypothetical protein